jgi:hypothetical protein
MGTLTQQIMQIAGGRYLIFRMKTGKTGQSTKPNSNNEKNFIQPFIQPIIIKSMSRTMCVNQ